MQRLLAAFIFFTRLPFWRLADVPAEAFKRVVPFWPLTGWLTAGLSVLVLYLASLFFPVHIAILTAIATRLLITGCLHEDGLADVSDGFGGGTSHERILSIMKDSHIGTFGVIALFLYFGFYYLLLSSLPLEVAGCALLAGDPYSKAVAAMVINRLPYARKEEESKIKTSYNPMTGLEYIICISAGSLPLFMLPSPVYLLAALLPVLTWLGLTNRMKRKIQGYTGDCCGALFLLCELSFYAGIVLIYQQI